jgi:hypothetical protein
MAPHVWVANQLREMSPAEQDAVFEASVVTDLDVVPTDFLARIRARLIERIAKSTPSQPA